MRLLAYLSNCHEEAVWPRRGGRPIPSRTPPAPRELCLFPIYQVRSVAINALRSRVRRFESYWGRLFMR